VNRRRARFYRLTPLGRRQLSAELSDYTRIVRAIALVVSPVPAEG
jgi:hypothetical protein